MRWQPCDIFPPDGELILVRCAGGSGPFEAVFIDNVWLDLHHQTEVYPVEWCGISIFPNCEGTNDE